MGIRALSFCAWTEVRGKPSRMKDAEGALEGREGAASERDVVGGTQDFAFSSPRMRRRIMSSGTSEPDFMCDCASCPNGVLFRTALRSRSPELTAESWGNRFMRRSACVPLPTPGAPTRIIRAARLNSFVAIDEGGVCERSWGLGGSAAWDANGGGELRGAARSSRLRQFMVTASSCKVCNMYKCTESVGKSQWSLEMLR